MCIRNQVISAFWCILRKAWPKRSGFSTFASNQVRCCLAWRCLKYFAKGFNRLWNSFPFVSNACHRHLGCRVSRLLQYASLETTENFDGASSVLLLKTQEIPRSSRSRGHPWNNLDEHPHDPLLLCRRTLAHLTSRLHSSQSKWAFSP